VELSQLQLIAKMNAQHGTALQQYTVMGPATAFNEQFVCIFIKHCG
jgi:hypothetical protein